MKLLSAIIAIGISVSSCGDQLINRRSSTGLDIVERALNSKRTVVEIGINDLANQLNKNNPDASRRAVIRLVSKFADILSEGSISVPDFAEFLFRLQLVVDAEFKQDITDSESRGVCIVHNSDGYDLVALRPESFNYAKTKVTALSAEENLRLNDCESYLIDNLDNKFLNKRSDHSVTFLGLSHIK